MIVYCACGKPLHYTDPADQARVERLVAAEGPDIMVRLGNRTWLVPRHYIALHGVKGSDLPGLRFPEVRPDGLFLSYAHDSGGFLVDLRKPDFQDQCFTHIDDDDDRVRVFHVPKLKQLISENQCELREFEVDDEQAAFVMQNRGVEEEHLQRISDLDEPGIICEWPDGSQLTVDGNHRLVARARRKLPTMHFWMVPEKLWRKALLKAPSAFGIF